jgi:hypothetical protein
LRGGAGGGGVGGKGGGGGRGEKWTKPCMHIWIKKKKKLILGNWKMSGCMKDLIDYRKINVITH